MSKKDYILIARLFKATRPFPRHGTDAMFQWKKDVEGLAQELQNDNSKFNRSTFLSTTGYIQL